MIDTLVNVWNLMAKYSFLQQSDTIIIDRLDNIKKVVYHLKGRHPLGWPITVTVEIKLQEPLRATVDVIQIMGDIHYDLPIKKGLIVFYNSYFQGKIDLNKRKMEITMLK